MKRFLYLFQVPDELPSRLRHASSSDSDVLFLSYRERSADPRSVFYPHSSWTQGRNRLLKEAMGKPYTYFVFGDADVRLEHTRRGKRTAARGENPWRTFERFLLRWEPAVGCPAYFWHRSSVLDERRDVESLRFFDPILNAFHREALSTILPYFDLLDEVCEYYSGSILSSIAAELHPGHVLQTNDVRALNTEHMRGYGEHLLTKPETLYLESLRDPSRVGAYRRQTHWELTPHPAGGEPRAKTGTYHVEPEQLADIYHLDHRIWARKREILELPLDSDLFSADADSERARRWRAVRVPPPPFSSLPLGRRLVLTTRKLRAQLGMVRTGRLWDAWERLRLLLRAPRLAARRRRQFRAVSVLWQQWAASSGDPGPITGAEPGELIGLLGYALQQLPHGEVLFVEVGTGGGEVLTRLTDGSVLTRPVLAIGADFVPTRATSEHAGYVLGPIGEEPFSLATILAQYGLCDRTIHWVRIAAGRDGIGVLRSLRDRIAHTLFTTLEGPSWNDAAGVLAAADFRLLHVAATGPAPQATFVNVPLLRTLLPGWLP